MKHDIRWLPEPEDHDYTAAEDYLSLLTSKAEAARIADWLRELPTRQRKAKDILRASQLPLLPASNTHVVKDQAKAASGERLSPVLLVRGQHGDKPLTIADGYHRVCAVYHIDEDAVIACRITGWDV
jgi:hypothetical protein